VAIQFESQTREEAAVMELKWLEDMLLLLETGSFSKAARYRNITQPAFSRRIRSLENWLGATLVDRRRNPLRFTRAALNTEAEMRHLVNGFYELRGRVRAETQSKRRMIFTTQHTLTVTHLPRLLHFLERRRPRIAYRVRSANKEECVTQMARGEADFLLCYEMPSLGTGLASGTVRRMQLGRERLLPVTACGAPNIPIHVPQEGEPLPLLLYPEDSFLGQVLRDTCLPRVLKTYSIETVCESAFSVGVKEMTLSGLGIAWLPLGLVEAELARGILYSHEETLGACEMSMSLYAAATPSSAETERVWQELERAGPSF